MQSRGAAKHRDFDRSLANSIKPLPSPPRRRRLERGRATTTPDCHSAGGSVGTSARPSAVATLPPVARVRSRSPFMKR
jgi:hypothetical protein